MLGAGWDKIPFLFSPRKQILALHWDAQRHLWEEGVMTRASCLQVYFHVDPHGFGPAQLLGTVVKQKRFATLRKNVCTAILTCPLTDTSAMLDDFGGLPL